MKPLHSLALRASLAAQLGFLFASPVVAGGKVASPLAHLLDQTGPGQCVHAWVYFADKGSQEAFKAAPPRTLVSPRSIARRLKVRPESRVVDATDLPLDPGYVEAVAARVARVRQLSKWFDAVSVEATREQIASVERLPFVRRIEAVARFRRKADEPIVDAVRGPRAETLNYGPSLGQLQQIHVTDLHDLGITGQGVLVGHFDNGYRLLSHECLASLQIVAGRDFVDHDADPAPPLGSPSNVGSHGIATLSTLAGYAPGQLIGAAFGASYVLARTENDASETPVEEDNWVAAIEWADSLGVDVTSTSLGYLDYDVPFSSWTWQDMNGNTTLITRAADMAVGRGIVVVNSAGNGGIDALDPTRNTLGAPADGDSVISAGAVTSAGVRSTFSSVGPTTDVPARIKPDVMAQGSAVRVARTSGTANYGNSSGTSFSCPITAGVAALLLSASPAARPMQIRDAMRLTASQANSPDNLMGWGILNALAALNYLNAATDVEVVRPAAFRLEPNVPNPFNPTTTLRYALPEPAFVTLRIYDASGRWLRTLVHGQQDAREHPVIWDGKDARGAGVPSGVYLYSLRAEGVAGPGAGTPHVYATKGKMVLAR